MLASIQAERLPLRYACVSTCFRKDESEAVGIAGVRQFDKASSSRFKYYFEYMSWPCHGHSSLRFSVLIVLFATLQVEQFAVTAPESSWKVQLQMLGAVEKFYKSLGAKNECSDHNCVGKCV